MAVAVPINLGETLGWAGWRGWAGLGWAGRGLDWAGWAGAGAGVWAGWLGVGLGWAVVRGWEGWAAGGWVGLGWRNCFDRVFLLVPHLGCWAGLCGPGPGRGWTGLG